MNLTQDELEFLSAWAREEWEPACYQLPAHSLQLANKVSGAQLIVFIKAWTEGEGKKDQDILGVAANPQPRWPWPTTENFGDAWFIGFDTHYTVAVWVGYPNGIKPMRTEYGGSPVEGAMPHRIGNRYRARYIALIHELAVDKRDLVWRCVRER